MNTIHIFYIILLIIYFRNKKKKHDSSKLLKVGNKYNIEQTLHLKL
jgi:hypothetical protein